MEKNKKGYLTNKEFESFKSVFKTTYEAVFDEVDKECFRVNDAIILQLFAVALEKTINKIVDEIKQENEEDEEL